MTNFFQNISAAITRRLLAGRDGVSFDGERDLYSVLGYPRTIRPLDYIAMYERGGIAARIVDAFPDATWSQCPKIIEDSEKDDTPFEQAIELLSEKKRLFHYLARADKLSGLGRYSILILGTNDGIDLAQPLRSADQLSWLLPVPEAFAEITRWTDDPLSPEFGRPQAYRVTFGSIEDSTRPNVTREVHASRVIHIAENPLQDDVFGTPRLRPVYNHLIDLQKVAGGSAEMFWLGARQGMIFEADPDASFDGEAIEQLEDQADEFQHQLRRLLTSQGGKWRSLEAHDPKPQENADLLLSLCSGTSGIPKRILIGAEAGQLASSQDLTSWLSRVTERRINFIEPVIIRKTIDRLIALGVIPPPADGTYTIEWDLETGISEIDAANIALQKTQALATYANAPYAAQVVPETEFREKMLGLEPEPYGGFDTEDGLPDVQPTPEQ